jgi:hypothetical protein
MFTNQGKYYTGEKTHWEVFTSHNGQVTEIRAAVKAWDNEGRAYQGPVRSLSAAEVAKATASTQDFQELIAVMIRTLYESNVRAKQSAVMEGRPRLRRLAQSAANSPEAKEDAKPETETGSGAVLENG